MRKHKLTLNGHRDTIVSSVCMRWLSPHHQNSNRKRRTIDAKRKHGRMTEGGDRRLVTGKSSARHRIKGFLAKEPCRAWLLCRLQSHWWEHCNFTFCYGINIETSLRCGRYVDSNPLWKPPNLGSAWKMLSTLALRRSKHGNERYSSLHREVPHSKERAPAESARQDGEGRKSMEQLVPQ